MLEKIFKTTYIIDRYVTTWYIDIKSIVNIANTRGADGAVFCENSIYVRPPSRKRTRTIKRLAASFLAAVFLIGCLPVFTAEASGYMPSDLLKIIESYGNEYKFSEYTEAIKKIVQALNNLIEQPKKSKTIGFKTENSN